jgi:prolyl-tRNA synthetase
MTSAPCFAVIAALQLKIEDRRSSWRCICQRHEIAPSTSTLGSSIVSALRLTRFLSAERLAADLLGINFCGADLPYAGPSGSANWGCRQGTPKSRRHVLQARAAILSGHLDRPDVHLRHTASTPVRRLCALAPVVPLALFLRLILTTPCHEIDCLRHRHKDLRANAMRLSRYFLPVLKETPKEAEIISHQLMLRAGMIKQESAGIYAWLPLGLRVLEKINRVVREEQNRTGAVELLMPTIQSADLWRESGRYEAYGKEMLRIQDRHERDMLFGPTNEEMITGIFSAHVKSYKQLPLNLYHIQWKFRDEVRPRFGVMRSREFLMKDAYSFDLDQASARHAYNKMFVAYLRTFARLGLKSIPMRADTGPIGGDLSHEFIILADTGESEVFCHKDYLDYPVPSATTNFDDIAGLQATVDKWTGLYAATSEMHDASAYEALNPDQRVSARGIEVGHIFYFGTKYSAPMKAAVQGPDGKPAVVHMGSYGIGPTRVAAAIVEASHDANGIIWPVAVAPFEVGLINLKPGDKDTDFASNDLYQKLERAGVSVLIDDTDERAGGKFATMDLIGLPFQLIVGPKGIKTGEVEIKERKTGERASLSMDAALRKLSDLISARRMIG